MDLNLTVLNGRLATTPELRVLAGGTTVARMLITIRTDLPRRRIDVVPVTVWDDDLIERIKGAEKGDRVWAAGAIQRRFWSDENSRQSRIEVVASSINVMRGDDRADFDPTDMLEEA
jgi:single-stranded DNA-binding protein